MKQLLSVALLSAVAFSSFAIGKNNPIRDCSHSHKSCGPLQELKLVGNRCECECKGNLVKNEQGHCVKGLKMQ